MWFILFIQAPIFLFPSDLVQVQTAGFELIVNEFLLLGIIPGTDIAITFNWIIASLWILFFYWLTTKLSFGRFEKHRLFKKSQRINQISL